ncbi:MAG: aldolase/citrate lyase family protein [Longimicrobiales bacterium]
MSAYGFRQLFSGATAAIAVTLAWACSPAADQAQSEPEVRATPATAPTSDAPLVQHLEAGHAIFGIFSGEKTPEQGLIMGQNRGLDFVFYSLEQGPFDIPTMQAYAAGVAEGGGHPMALRIPPVGDDPEGAATRAGEALAAGVSAIVIPHVQNGSHAEAAVQIMGAELWPGNPAGSVINMLIVEDIAGIENVDEIMSTPGVSVVFAGPGDLSRAYERDMEAVENAIQAVLASCQQHGVPCGITAGADDIATRIEQGFQVIIVTEAEAVPVGRAAAGRD